jgi:hypothetical protein
MPRNPICCLIALALSMVVAASSAHAACPSPQLAELVGFSAGHIASELAIGDVNNDGITDVVTVAASSVNIHIGTSVTTFELPMSYPVVSADDVALGDLNGDDFLDIVVSFEPGTNEECLSFGSCAGFSVLLNDGDGTFGLATTFPIPFATGVVGLGVADLDDDFNADVFSTGPSILSTDPAAHVLFGDGTGTAFPRRRAWSVDGFIHDGILAKLDGPFSVPSVVLVVGPGTSSTFTRVNAYQSQTGTFPGVTDDHVIASGSITNAQLTTGDFDQNGTLDIAVGRADTPTQSGATIVLANGSSQLTQGGALSTTAPAPLQDLAAADYDEDSDLDLLTVYGQGIWRGFTMNKQNFTTVVSQTINQLPGAARVVTDDFNSDGLPDFLVLDTTSGNLAILLNACSSRYSKVTLSSSPNPSIFGSDATFTITVEPKPDAPTPTGTVTLFENTTVRGMTTLNGSGVGTITLSALSVGTHMLHAVYDGDSNFASQTSPTHSHTVNEPPFGAALNVTATGNGAANEITIQWTPTGGVASYDVLRRLNGAWSVIGNTTGNSFLDSNVVNTSAFVYAVQSHGTEGELSPISNSDIATTATLVLPGDNRIRASDVLSTRFLVNSLRSAAGLAAFTFTDASLTGVKVKALHITQLRMALNEARTTLGFPALTFTNPTLTPNVTTIRKVDVQEIRNSFL